ncbi:hypothetical protein QUF61_16075 [Candidatus Venteria ishoeyi]|uniref:WD40/YVTN/BNR-like repeat-containing protein n=1 Tax=Candidatus Venteria ishoeyi TaxID=1899563 RepID=UPI0025A5BA07|nr:hypothetical protein [Candidatus Venteria ishoeyi]MDM8548006.1 hypothetical protein [Candidatus Venteria ishoeyi]
MQAWESAFEDFIMYITPSPVLYRRASIWRTFYLLCFMLFSISGQSAVWESSGPAGGRFSAIASDPLTPSTLYIGSKGGQVYKSTNSGVNWSLSSSGLPGSQASGNLINDIVIDPENSNQVYAASSSAGIYFSSDGAASWSPVNGAGLDSLVIQDLLINNATLYAATESGVYFSTDRGANWSATTLTQFVRSLEVDKADSTRLYAGGAAGSFWNTATGGDWALSANPIGSGSLDIRDLKMSDAATGSGLLYAATNQGLYSSDDQGQKWVQNTALGNVAINAITFKPSHQEWIFLAMEGGGIYYSTDNGTNWITPPATLAMETMTALVFEPGLPTLHAAGYRGHWKTEDLGETWLRDNSGLNAMTANFIVADHNTAGGVYLGADKDGLFYSDDSGVNWTMHKNGLPDPIEFEPRSFAIDPQNSQNLYLGLAFDGVMRSSDGGVNWSPSTLTASAANCLTVDPLSTATVYACTGSTGVSRSIDSGNTWNPTGLSSGEALTVLVHPQDSNLLYASVLGSGVLKSSDAGISWSPINTGLTELSVYALVMDAMNPDVLYAGTAVGIFRSNDAGANWTLKNTGLTDIFIQAIVSDPLVPNLLHLATESGVFYSDNGGDNWSLRNEGLDILATEALSSDAATTRHLYAAIRYAGLYRRQLDPALNQAPQILAPTLQQVAKDTTFVFSNALGNTITISDADAGLNAIQLLLSTSNATLSLGSTAGIEFITGDGVDDGSMQLSAPVAQLNAALQGLQFIPALGTTGTTAILLELNDLGNTGADGEKTDSAVITMLVQEPVIQDKLSIQLPLPTTAFNDTPLILSATNAIIVANTDPAISTLDVQLSVAPDGLLTLSDTTGLVFTEGDGLDDNAMHFQGTLAQINLALDGLAYTSSSTFVGEALLTIQVDDAAATSTAAQISDTLSITIQAGSNTPPQITPLAIQEIFLGDSYNVMMLAVDAQGHLFDYALLHGPKMATIDTATGELNWLPEQSGHFSFVVQVTETNGQPVNLSSQYEFTLSVKTVDGSQVGIIPGWKLLSTNLPTAKVKQLQVSPLNDKVLYAATEQGLFRSEDRGVNWLNRGRELGNLNISTLAQHPAFKDVLYAGTLGTGVYRSVNGGFSWQAINADLPGQQVRSLRIDPFAHDTLYLALADTGQNDGGVFVSHDRGDSWSALTTTLAADVSVYSLQVDPFSANTLYIGSTQGELLKTSDAGASWVSLSQGLTGNNVQGLTFDPGNLMQLYVLSDSGLFSSNDGGLLWQVMNSGLENLQINSLKLNTNNTQVLYVATNQGVYQSMDAGAQWATLGADLATIEISALALSTTQTASYLYAAGLAQGIYGYDVITGKPVDFDLSQVELTTLTPEEMPNIPAEAFATFTADDVAALPAIVIQKLSALQLSYLQKEALAGLSLAQFSQMPLSSLKGLTADNFGGLAVEIIQNLPPAALLYLDMETLKQAMSWTLTRFFTNLNVAQIPISSIKPLLPAGWTLDETTGELLIPAGTSLSWRSLEPPADLPAAVTLASEQPDLRTGMGMGGETGGKNLLDDILALLQTLPGFEQLTITQTDTGVVSVDDILSLMPLDVIRQAEPGTPPGVALDEQGRIQVTTLSGHSLILVPTASDPVQVQQVLGAGFSIEVGKAGELLVGIGLGERRDASQVHLAVSFDPVIEVAPNGAQAGVFIDNARGDLPLFVFPNNTAQVIRPAILAPGQFKKVVDMFGPDQVLFNQDGTVDVSLLGDLYHVTPTFETTTETLAPGQQIEPSIVVNPDISLQYSVQQGLRLISTRLEVEIR